METNNGREESNEILFLKALLEKWKLPHLLYHFLAQKINVDILKMMKSHHIGEALNSFPLGDRIRFEYELENWRQKMGVPLESHKACTALPNISLEVQEKGTELKTVEKSDTSTKGESLLVPMSTPSESSTSNGQKLPTITVKKLSQTLQKPQTEMVPPSALGLSRQRSQLPASASNSCAIRKRAPSVFVPPKELTVNAFSLDARKILMQCAPRGPQLIETYETCRCFTAAERAEIINLFANFFHRHSIHLSLKMAHVLENQILKLFPGERLKDYRTENRGRIYIRLGNIKNFQSRSTRAKVRQRSLQQFVISCLEEDNEQATITENEPVENDPLYDESNSPDIVTDIVSYSPGHFACPEMKTEGQEEFM